MPEAREPDAETFEQLKRGAYQRIRISADPLLDQQALDDEPVYGSQLGPLVAGDCPECATSY